MLELGSQEVGGHAPQHGDALGLAAVDHRCRSAFGTLATRVGSRVEPGDECLGLVLGEPASGLALGEPEGAASVPQIGMPGGDHQRNEVLYLPSGGGRTGGLTERHAPIFAGR